MKKQFFLLLLTVSCLTLKAEHSQTLSQELPPEQSLHFSATDHISLLPGFLSEPKDGHEVLIEINAFDVTPPETGITGGPSPGDDGVVGALNGSIDVSTLGGATYTIPIQLPQGLGGLSPQLAIYYNNQQKNGLLGWNWDLLGISAITRTGGSLYHDGYVSPVNYTDDRFCLDGQRLHKVSNGEYGEEGTEYRTEVDRMSKIVSYTIAGVNGPAYFKVWTADGKILTYGSSSDSRALVSDSNQVNVWLLKNVKDNYGNSIVYKYQNTTDSYRLTKIQYSSNDNDDIDPAFSVVFNYSNRNDIEIIYHGTCLQKKDALLQNITVKNGSNTMFVYSFNYQEPAPQTGYPYPLLTSIEYVIGNNHFNPTKIQWDNNNYNITLINNTSIPVTTTSINSAFSHAVKFSGDFNGDGFTDVLAVRAKLDGSGSYNNMADLFLNKGISGGEVTFDYQRSFSLNPFISWIYVADFNGDGRDDILLTDRQRRDFPYPDLINSTIYLSKINTSNELVFTIHEMPSLPIKNELVESLLIGDFFGEGKQSILIQALTSERSNNEKTVMIRYEDQENGFQSIESQESLEASRFFPADYNGDGATEILYKNHLGFTVIQKLSLLNGAPHYTRLFHGYPDHWDDCFPGDYNADGNCDALFYKQDATRPWFIALSNQSGISSSQYYLSDDFPYDTPGNYQFSLDCPNETSHFIKTGDFDGNGCSDLVLLEGNTFHVYYGPINPNSPDAPFSSSRHINTQIFHYFSNMDLCLGNFLGKDNLSFLGNYSISHLPSINPRHEVKSITDGMGQTIEFQYDYLMPNPHNPSPNDFYYLPSTAANPTRDIFNTYLPFRGLKKATTYNIKNKPVTIECHFEGALLHKKGKGFLGFTKTIQKDYCNHQLQRQTERHFNIELTENAMHPMMLEEEVYDKEGNLMASTWYTNQLFVNMKNDKVLIPISDKTISEYDMDQDNHLLKKEINETVVSTHTNLPYQYNKTISVTETKKGVTSNPSIVHADFCEFLSMTLTTYYADIPDRWIINRPKKIIETQHQTGGDPDISRQRFITYQSSKPYQVKSVTEYPNAESYSEDPRTKRTEYQYDPTGNIVSKTVKALYDTIPERTEFFEYSEEYGRRLLTKHTNAAGHVTTFKYHPVYSHRTSMTDCNQLETKYEQDPLGVTVTTTHPDGTKTCQAVRWGHGGYYLWEKKTGQATKITDHALTGEVIREQSYALNGEMTQSTFEYDLFGRIEKETLPHLENRTGLSIRYNYDDHHRVNRVDHFDGTREVMNYEGHLSQVTYQTPEGVQQTESKTTNAMGWVIRSTDADGTSIIYDYYPDGKPKWTQIEGADDTRIEIGYDGFGNRTSIYDPDYGLTIDEYNAFGELTHRTLPNYITTDYEYDCLGNKIRRTETNKKSGDVTHTEWLYSSSPETMGLLMEINSGNQTINYTYDKLLRLQTVSENYLGKEYKTTYSYDEASRVSRTTYPSDYTIQYCYSSEGHLRSITDESSKPLWRLDETNALGIPTKYTTGNGFVSTYDYDPTNNKLKSIKTIYGEKTIQDYQYTYDGFSNMTERLDLKHNFNEKFTYDQLNRLITAKDNDGEDVFGYDPLGRMTSKTSKGQPVFTNANYDGPKPHTIKTAQTQQGIFPQDRMDLEYTGFGKVSSITEGDKQVTFQYGYDHQRIKTSENINGQLREKTYINSCEFITQPDGGMITRTFLTCPTGVFAVVETTNNSTSVYYIHKDHLGSWTVISDSKGSIQQENQFDAWGNLQSGDPLMFDRGFTGHEHIKGMNLINMNGRLYDPVTSSMLNPDPYVQMPDCTQNFNRYAYCMNNPLTYVDPDGNTFIESALIFYVLFCTDLGYELQKDFLPIALHLDLHLSTQQLGLGIDASVGVPKTYALSVRFHGGLTYYWDFYDHSYQGWEFRTGMELGFGGVCGISGTNYYFGGKKQTTNTIYIGNSLWRIDYENDFMFNISKDLLGFPHADNGDRYRTAAAKIRIGLFSLGVNIFTGDPGINSSERRTFIDPSNNRETYTIGANGEDPDEYRAGVLYVGYGPIKVGMNSEQIRNIFQNRFAHDFLCCKDSPYFKVLDRPTQAYFYFGSGTGGSLW